MGFEFYYRYRKVWIALTTVIAIIACALLPRLEFAFNFEQFFPEGDEDLEFFQRFVEEFETDDNFLMIAVQNEPSIIDADFLQRVRSFAHDCSSVQYVQSVQSLPTIQYPVWSGIGPQWKSLVPDPITDTIGLQEKWVSDQRLVHNLINDEANSTVVFIKTEDGVQLNASKTIISQMKMLLDKYQLHDYHMLGRAYFQSELSRLQFREILISTIVSGFLICIIMVLIFRKWRIILIALSSIGLALLVFLGLMSLWGRPMSMMAALYPILMLIVGTSDVIHIMSKYIDEIRKGNERKSALQITVKQIGLATLLTSITTAVGFASLLSSRIVPIQEFGVNSAIGVILAYVLLISFTCPLISLIPSRFLVHESNSKLSWDGFLHWCYDKSRSHEKLIIYGFVAFVILSIIGISQIHTNYELKANLPKNSKITEDFEFFEKEYAGFRPLEIAVFLGQNTDIYDYELIKSVHDTEQYLRSLEPIKTSISMATLVNSLHQAFSFMPLTSASSLPDSTQYSYLKPLLSQGPIWGSEALISADKRKTRISARIKDIGADNIKALSQEIDGWLEKNIDHSVALMRQTGTGLILDKNAEFVRESLLYGLGLALIIVSLLMGLLFKKIKYLFIAVVPNVVPLVFAAALIGFGDIPLEAGTSIIFAIIFGIAVDDTIHFMSKYRMSLDMYGDSEKAMITTFVETGKAIIYTTIILFFGFMVLLFSANKPSVIIGCLISITLISAVIADLFLLPVIIRKFDRPSSDTP